MCIRGEIQRMTTTSLKWRKGAALIVLAAFAGCVGLYAGGALAASGGAQPASRQVQAESGARDFVADMGEKALSFLKDSSLGEDSKAQQFRRLLENNFDMPTIARFSLGQYWRQMSPQQQKEYTSLFREYVVKVYSARFREYSGQTFQTTGARKDNATDTIVGSAIQSPGGGDPVSVDWRVRYKNGQYKIVDVIVEGVSMTLTQRSDFSAVIQKGGGSVQAILSQLRQQAG